MAFYKYTTHLVANQHANFDTDRSPGETAIDAGIYRCTGCGDEIGIAKGHTLPPQNHHQHTNLSPVRWRLLVCAVQA